MTRGGYHSIRNGSIGQRLKFLLGDSVLYGGASAISKLLSLFTLPILTRVFSTAEYGAVDAIAVFGNLFIFFIAMGQDAAMVRFFYDTEDVVERKQIIAQALLIQFVLCLLVTLGLLLTANFLVERVIATPGYTMEFRVLVASFPFVIFTQVCRNLLRFTFARRQYLFLSLGSTVLIVALTLVLVWGFDLGRSKNSFGR